MANKELEDSLDNLKETIDGMLRSRDNHIDKLLSDINDLQTENARLQAGGCARDQKTTQFCAEAIDAKRRADAFDFLMRMMALQMEADGAYVSTNQLEYAKKTAAGELPNVTYSGYILDNLRNETRP